MSVFDWFCGARQAQQQLAESRQRLYRMALAWTGDPALADDLAQETLTRALQKAHQVRDPERFNGWLFAVLHSCWREHLRRRRPEQLDEEEKHRLPAGDPGPAQLRNSGQISALVRAAVADLPDGQRQVVSLVDLEGLSYAEVAGVLSVPVGTVMSRLCRARRALQSRLLSLHQETTESARLRGVKCRA